MSSLRGKISSLFSRKSDQFDADNIFHKTSEKYFQETGVVNVNIKNELTFKTKKSFINKFFDQCGILDDTNIATYLDPDRHTNSIEVIREMMILGFYLKAYLLSLTEKELDSILDRKKTGQPCKSLIESIIMDIIRLNEKPYEKKIVNEIYKLLLPNRKYNNNDAKTYFTIFGVELKPSTTTVDLSKYTLQSINQQASNSDSVSFAGGSKRIRKTNIRTRKTNIKKRKRRTQKVKK